MSTLLIKNIGLLATAKGHQAKRGIEQKDVEFLSDAFIYMEDGIIKKVGSGDISIEADEIIDAKGKLVTPGLVDSHSHLVFGGWRANEMKMKLEGVPYLDILKAGGGILSTVNATINSTKEELIDKSLKALNEMLHFGTTTLEAKSGYGLEAEEEIKQLEVTKKLDELQPIDLVSTFLGAHALPEKYKECREEFIDKVCEVIPYIAENKLAEFCDVFCEKGVFTVSESERILKKGLEYGLQAKIHADEIEAIGGSVLAGKLKAISAEHLIVCNDEGIKSLAEGGTIACLLPATSFYLGAEFARARKMIEAGVPIALATDFNPGSCPCLNMQFVMNLGCLKYKMTPEEVLTAVTLNGAAAIDRADKVGSIEEGKYGDVLIWDSYDLNYIFYRLGSNLIDKVIKKGKVVVDNEKAC